MNEKPSFYIRHKFLAGGSEHVALYPPMISQLKAEVEIYQRSNPGERFDVVRMKPKKAKSLRCPGCKTAQVY